MNSGIQLEHCRELARTIRRHVLRMTHRNGSHIGSCYSIADLIAVLYGKTLWVDSATPTGPIEKTGNQRLAVTLS